MMKPDYTLFDNYLAISNHYLNQENKRQAAIVYGYAAHVLLQIASCIDNHQQQNDLAVAYSLLGLGYRQCNQYTKAVTYYTLAIQCEPKQNSINYNNRAIAYLLNGQYEAALQDARTARWELYPQDENYVDLYFNSLRIAAHACICLEHYEKAIRYFIKALKLSPFHFKKFDEHNNLGVALIKLKRYQEAQRLFEYRLSLATDQHLTYYHLGCIMQETQQWANAIDYFTKAIALKPDDAASYKKRAETYFACQHYQAALADCDKAIYFTDDSKDGLEIKQACETIKQQVEGAQLNIRLTL